MNEPNEHSIAHEIQMEYSKIDNRWLRLHFYTLAGIVVFGLIVECILGLVWFRTGQVGISTAAYIVKYFVAPFSINLALLLTSFLVVRSSAKMKTKEYTISLLFVSAGFVFYMVHSMFYALFLLFTIPILMTVVYSDHRLTLTTASLSIALKAVCDLFIVWDPDKVNPLQSDLGTVNFIISIFILGLFTFGCMIVTRFGKEKNAASLQKEIEHYETQQKLKIDDLTGIYNRVALRKAFQGMQEDAPESSYIFVMIDIDNFKTLNDTYGHAKGDNCLKEFADILKNNCGPDTLPFRFGGDEFCILFKNNMLKNVIDTCRAIQRDLKESAAGAPDMCMTASFGIARYEKGMFISQLLKDTDLALYRAKAERDSINVYGDIDSFA